MNPDVKGKWTTALRSGDYQQGDGALRSGNNFCCLGVLCDLAVKDGILDHPTLNADRSTYNYDGEAIVLPDPVMKWAGFDLEVNYRIGRYKVEGGVETLTEHNDGGDTFDEIADIIDREF